MLHNFSYKQSKDDEVMLVCRKYACAAIDLERKFSNFPGLLPAMRMLLDKRDAEIALIKLKRAVQEVN